MRNTWRLSWPLVALLMLASCSDDGEESGDQDVLTQDTADQEDTSVDDCGCDNGCPQSACNLVVELEATCRNAVESATVLLAGCARGT